MPRKVMYGPIQFSAVAFDDYEVIGDLIDELYLVREVGIIRLIDFMFVAKDEDGDLVALEVTDLTDEERIKMGAVIGGLIGYGAAGEEGMEAGAEIGAMAAAENDFGLLDDDIMEVLEDLPRGKSAMLVLFEHAWAKRLKQAMVNHGGVLLAQGFIHPLAFVALGVEMAEAVREEEQWEYEQMMAEKAESKKKGTSTKELEKKDTKKKTTKKKKKGVTKTKKVTKSKK